MSSINLHSFPKEYIQSEQQKHYSLKACPGKLFCNFNRETHFSEMEQMLPEWETRNVFIFFHPAGLHPL